MTEQIIGGTADNWNFTTFGLELLRKTTKEVVLVELALLEKMNPEAEDSATRRRDGKLKVVVNDDGSRKVTLVSGAVWDDLTTLPVYLVMREWLSGTLLGYYRLLATEETECATVAPVELTVQP